MPKRASVSLDGDRLIPLKDVCLLVPGGVSRSTVYQWANRGVKSRATLTIEYLEIRIVAGRKYTTPEAVTRFLGHFESGVG